MERSRGEYRSGGTGSGRICRANSTFYAFSRHHQQYLRDNLDLEQLALTATQALPALETWAWEV